MTKYKTIIERAGSATITRKVRARAIIDTSMEGQFKAKMTEKGQELSEARRLREEIEAKKLAFLNGE